MTGRFTVFFCVSAALVLLAQPAVAGSRVYVNIGVPVVEFEVRGGAPCGDKFRIEGSYCPGWVAPYPERVYVVREVVPYPEYIWVEGYYLWERPRHVWVPGHWQRVSNHRGDVQTPKHWNKPRQNDRNQQNHQNWDRGRGHWEHDD